MALLKKLIKVIKKIFRPARSRRKSRRVKKTRGSRNRTTLHRRRKSLLRKKSRNSKKAPRKATKKTQHKKRRLSTTIRSVLRKKAPLKSSFPRSRHRPAIISREGARSAAPQIPQHIGSPAVPVFSAILVGEVTHYFSKIMVVVVKVTHDQLRVGDKIRIKGHITDFIQKVESLQIESVNVPTAHKGQLVGLKVVKETRVGDHVYHLER
jgi:hypothetical protein